MEHIQRLKSQAASARGIPIPDVALDMFHNVMNKIPELSLSQFDVNEEKVTMMIEVASALVGFAGSVKAKQIEQLQQAWDLKKMKKVFATMEMTAEKLDEPEAKKALAGLMRQRKLLKSALVKTGWQ